MNDLVLLNCVLPRLPALKALVQHRSVQAAASALRVTPSAVSQSVKRAEKELRTPLFQRTQEGFLPTPALSALLREYEPLERAVRVSRTVAREQLRGHVRLFGQNQILSLVAAKDLATFSRAHPEVQMSVEMGSADRAVELFRKNLIDLAFCARLPQIDELRLERVRCFDLSIAMVGNPTLIERMTKGGAQRGRRSVWDLPQVMTYPDQSLLKAYCRQARLPFPRFQIKCPVTAFDLVFVKEMVLNGVGFAVMPIDFILPELERGELVIVRGMPRVALPIYLAWKKELTQLPTGLALRDWLTTRLRKPDSGLTKASQSTKTLL